MIQPALTSRWAFALVLPLALAACSKPEPAAEPIRSVRTLVVPSGRTQGQHEYPAEVRARVESRLAFRVGGKLTKRWVEAGDAVRAGQTLAQLDPQDLQLSQDGARAALAVAKANLDIQEAEFKRYTELRAQGFISSLELERREATLKAARAQADQARSQVAVQSNQTRYAVLIADAAGVVIGVDSEPGAVVSAGTTVLRLAQDGARDVVFSVPEDRATALRALLGKREAISVRLTGAGGQLVKASVREIAAAADATTRTFWVKADIGQSAIRLGQTATVVVDEPAVEGIVKLPLTSIFEQQGKSVVWVLDPSAMTVAARPVQVAGTEGNLVLIAAGVAPGQTVVTAGVHTLSPGQKVRRYQEPLVAATAAKPAVTPPPTPAPIPASGVR